MKLFTCAFSIENWQSIEKSGGVVYSAGCLWISYYAKEKIV
ncbi:hypothetical protein QE332_gp077 [Pseudomonas phage vB_PaeM_LCK69]|uniref:Uncharacterized protein n=1 Tax=Pseudomonas phage vB_PaeM_LCK69 TaxID=2488595 RepID=A0A3G8F7X9_9CAUD|nr:hypothetical protein QE332_gp077 [Pseudomonas phage vB_PaeM_LCK69]AZF89688.1 hypothetical protein [Pseudomonas phage vB_PaeM_LCK69]